VQLQELLADVDVLDVRGDATVDVNTLEHDSRRVAPGACFACIVGSVTDGHHHAPSAVENGAVALLVERQLDLGVPEARVADVRRALGPAAARLYGQPSTSLRCLGVTGTNGKTTTTYLLEAIAAAAGERAGLIGTVGARIAGQPVPVEHTTPEATDLQRLLAHMRDDGVRTVAMEVSSHALAQHRIDGTHFTAVCFTNLSRDHLDYHRSLDDYFETKARLFDPARADAATVNLDDARGPDLAAQCRARGLPVTTFGIDRDADIMATDLRVTRDGSHVTLVGRGERTPVEIRLLGAVNIANAVAAAVTARVAGFETAAITAGLASVTNIPGRLEQIDTGQPFTVLVDYAHTPAALDAALRTAHDLPGTRRVIVVFGCGGDRDPDKRPLMGEVAANQAEVVIITSDNPRSEPPDAIAAAVLEGTRSGTAAVSVELDRRRAIRQALGDAHTGDVVLIAGKGHEAHQISGGATVEFDDRVVAREELGAGAWN
jgi:UDP-N-acetylmuramoyl-L-alanyl-D-glutamate--2,6-diaminopimelate ligase